MTKPKPPSEIHVVIRFSRRRGSIGYDITSQATTESHGKRIDLPSTPDCTYAENPFPRSGIAVSVWPPSDDSPLTYKK